MVPEPEAEELVGTHQSEQTRLSGELSSRSLWVPQRTLLGPPAAPPVLLWPFGLMDADESAHLLLHLCLHTASSSSRLLQPLFALL